MRYVGCKRRLLPFIHGILKKYHIEQGIFCDLFSGTATVGNYFKQQGFKIISNDLLYSSYVQQQVKVAINTMPAFKTIARHLGIKKNKSDCYGQNIVDYLNQLNGIEGFIYYHYSPGGTLDGLIHRKYFTDENAKKIDAVREIIEAWRQLDLLDTDEFHILLYALLEAVSKYANTTATQTSFLKRFYNAALKPLTLHLPTITLGEDLHHIYCKDSLELIHELEMVDVLYCDPPYTRRQYACAYHLLETIAQWDYPAVRGITGTRELQSPSLFNHKHQALSALQEVISQNNYRHLLLSYSNDSILSHEKILSLLKQYGEVEVHTQSLRRYNSMSCTDNRYNPQKQVIERLYYLKPFLCVPIHRYEKQRGDKRSVLNLSWQ